MKTRARTAAVQAETLTEISGEGYRGFRLANQPDTGKRAVLLAAAELAVLYLPAFAVSELLETWYPFRDSIYTIPALISLLCFCVLIDANVNAVLKKWALSVPFTVAFWLLLAMTDFSARLTNTLYPGYGRLSAGGGSRRWFV